MRNDINGISVGTLVTITKEYFIYSIEPYDIIGRRDFYFDKANDPSTAKIDKATYSRNWKRMDSILGEINQQQNPVISLCKIK